MTAMKKPIFRLLGVLIAGVLFISGCAKDSTDTGTSVSRDKFIGTWSVNESHTKLTYEVTISADPNYSNDVDIYNFAAAGPTIFAKATVDGSLIGISPANQTLSNGWVVDGSGELSGTTKISWNYTINDGANLVYAVATFTKK
jgi:hypothetical protein